MATMHFWLLYQLNIKNVFFHGNLAEEVYMEQPPSFVAQGSLVWCVAYTIPYVVLNILLKLGLAGLAQWFKSYGMTQSTKKGKRGYESFL